MNAFERLAPFIKDFIYRKKWTELHEIQVASCEVIFNSDDNLLLATGTASGKTEAAFLPALTVLYESPSKSIGILYISPLKALINDQFNRLDDLLMESRIPVHRWHGDVNQNNKAKLLNNPQGVLQITPESMESLLINRHQECVHLLSDLEFIIIDEVHYFMSVPRGIQLLSILERVQKLIHKIPRRIGLSATLGDYESAEAWLNSGTNRVCQTPNVNNGKKKLRISLHHFAVKANPTEEELNNEQLKHFKFIYDQTLGKKAIVFANSREYIEYTIANLKLLAKKNHSEDIYRVHHGSISKELREDTEKEMRESEKPIVTGATLTLELGIDIGNLDRIIQIGSPFSVSSFVQRLGRCGRRGNPAEIIFTFFEEESSSTDYMNQINWNFLKCIAIIQLYLEERWIEPVYPEQFAYGLLYHQTMSYLAEYGETAPGKLAQNILSLSPFKKISQEDYKALLKHLISIEHIQKTERGGLIIGIKGEPVVNYYEFYSVFETTEEYTVKTNNETIGTVVTPFPVGARFALAGHSWEATDINEKSHVIYVKEVYQLTRTRWFDKGIQTVHSKLFRKMKEILDNHQEIQYLSGRAEERLNQIREISKTTELTQKLVKYIGENKYRIFPWVGTKQMVALSLYLDYINIPNHIISKFKLFICIECLFKGDISDLEKILTNIKSEIIDKSVFTLDDEMEIPNKYNIYIPKVLLQKEFIEDFVDFAGLQREIEIL